MASSSVDPKPLLWYYVRQGFARTVISTVDESLKRRGTDSTLTFWKAVALSREGNFAGAIREVEALRSRRDAELPALLALRAFHSSSKAAHERDRAAALADIDAALPGARERALPAGHVLAGQFLLLSGDAAGARAAADHILRETADHDGANLLRGWVEVTSSMATHVHGMGPLISSCSPPPAPGALGGPASSSSLSAGSGAGGGSSSSSGASSAGAGAGGEGEVDAAAIRFERVMQLHAPGASGGASGSGPQTYFFLDAALGLAAAHERRGDYGAAVDVLTEALTAHNWFLPAACEQARLYAKCGDWDAAADTVSRVLEVDGSSIECHRLACLASLLREGPASLRAAGRLQELHAALGKAEPRSSRLHYDCARVLSRLCARARPLLSVTLAMVEGAVRLDPESSPYHAELGSQRLLAGDLAGAASAFREASRLDESNADALAGLIACQLAGGQLDEAEAQLDLFRLIAGDGSGGSGFDGDGNGLAGLGSYGSDGGDGGVGGAAVVRTPAAAIMDAQLAWRKHRDRRAQLKFTAEAVARWGVRLGMPLASAAAAAAAVSGSSRGGGRSGGSGAATSSAAARALLGSGIGDSGSSVRILAAAPSAALISPSDGLPLPTLLPGHGADIFEWYFNFGADDLHDALRELCLADAASASGAVTPASAAAAAAGVSSGGASAGESTAALAGLNLLSAPLQPDVKATLAGDVSAVTAEADARATGSSSGGGGGADGEGAGSGFDEGNGAFEPPRTSLARAAHFAVAQLQAAAGSPAAAAVPAAAPGRAAVALLGCILNTIPAHTPTWLAAAAAFAGAGAWDAAVGAAKKALSLSSSLPDAHLLLAQVSLARGDLRGATAALDAALATSFAVGSTPAFLRLQAATHAAAGRFADAVASCEAAMKLPGVRLGPAPGGRGGGAGRGSSSSVSSSSSSAGEVSLSDRAALFATLAESLFALEKIPEATAAVTDGLRELRGTAEEPSLLLAAARLSLRKGDADAALALLAALPGSASPAGQAAATVLRAEIQLTARRDRRAFLQCYKDLAARERNSEASLVALGDAHMRVQMPDEAVACYEQALAARPSNVALACKVGRALALTHDYGRAVTYYSSALAAAEAAAEEAAAAAGAGADAPASPGGKPGGPSRQLSTTDRALLRSDLTELLLRLRRFGDARSLIMKALSEATAALTAAAGARGRGRAAAAGSRGAGIAAGAGADVATLLEALTNAVDAVTGGDGDGASSGPSPGSGSGASTSSAAATIISLRFVRRNLQLLARVLRGTGDAADAAGAGAALRQAHVLQTRVLALARRDPAAASAATAAVTRAISGAGAPGSASGASLAGLGAGAGAGISAGASAGAGGPGGAAAIGGIGSGGVSAGGAVAGAGQGFSTALSLSLTHSFLYAAATVSAAAAASTGSASATGASAAAAAASAGFALPVPLPALAGLPPLELERLETAVLCMTLGRWCESTSLPGAAGDAEAERMYTQAAELSQGINTTALLPAPASAATSASASSGKAGDGSAAAAAAATAAAAAAAGSAAAAAVAADAGLAAGPPPSPYEAAMLALARLHLRRGDPESCRAVAESLVASCPPGGGGAAEAHLLLAQLLTRSEAGAGAAIAESTGAALYHLSALLERRPCAYEALASLLPLLKRAGRLSEASKYFKASLRVRPSAETADAGYKYCRGLFLRLSNEPHEAIRILNSVRVAGGPWAVRATEHMAQIYLSPDNEPLWAERDASKDGGDGGAALEALRVAGQLLDGIPPEARTPYHEVLACYVLIGQRDKASVDAAVARLNGVLAGNPDFPPALQALATAYAVQKQASKARVLLKRLTEELPLDAEWIGDSVSAYLLLSDLAIDGGKLDAAAEALDGALSLDSSSARAHEYRGAIAEKRGKHAEAAEFYAAAWKFDAEASAPVGYKLAFNYLKAGDPVRALDVCAKVLAQYPDYPRIRSEVMEKAQAAVRP